MKKKVRKDHQDRKNMKVGRKERNEGDLKRTSLYTRFSVMMALLPVLDQSVRLCPL